MCPELGENGRSESAMDAPVNNENEILEKEVENKLSMKCVSNKEDETFEEMAEPFVEQALEEGHGVGNTQIDRDRDRDEIVDEKCQESTECSTSFDYDSSDFDENGADFGDSEVVSDFRENVKKKLTPQWRKFIQPVMWRCKWIELQVKKLNSIRSKYERELEEDNRKKQIQDENLTNDGITKSVPGSSNGQRREVLKRRKRKRVEDITDVKAYMSQHNVFSYYESNGNGDGASLHHEWGNLENNNCNVEIGINDEPLLLESRDGDESLEQMLRKIGTLQGQVHQMKTRLDKVTSDHAGKFTYANNSSLLAPCSSARDPAFPPNNGGDTMAAGSSRGGLTYLPNIIESSNKSHLDGMKHTEDDILIYDKRVKEEMNNFEEGEIQSMENPQEPNEHQGNTIPLVLVDDQQPATKIRSISKLTPPKNKRKRGRRKSSYGRR